MRMKTQLPEIFVFVVYVFCIKNKALEQTTKYELMGCQGQKVYGSYLVHNCNTQQIYKK
jgi:hypothetical protein